MPYSARDHVNTELLPEVILAIVSSTKQGQLYPFLKYLSKLFFKTPGQEMQEALCIICASPHVSVEMEFFSYYLS